jgi:dUTPase
LANAEAVIDSDYIEETMVMLTNLSENPLTINNGDRIAQAEMIKSEDYVLWETMERPLKKTDRDGGLGSTGVAVFEPTDIQYVDTEEQQPEKRGRGRPKKVA